MPTKVVILCGGYGTRIRDVADDIPKPMLRIGDRPILWHIMKIYAHYGLKDFVLCLGYKSWTIKEYFLNYQPIICDFTITLGNRAHLQYHNDYPEHDWNITLVETGHDTQTGGRIRKVRNYLEGSDIFCITYGDGVGDINIDDLIRFHRHHGHIGTVTGVRPPGRFGVMEVDDDSDANIVKQFHEKPQTTSGLINGGFFVFDHRLWDYMNENPGLIFEGEPLARLAQAGELALYEHTGFWQPMDTYREWKLLNEMWATDNAPWKR
jgi:glucose-1-phosphate cytidylyltransferase